VSRFFSRQLRSVTSNLASSASNKGISLQACLAFALVALTRSSAIARG
jgi:hypothetical protein